MRIILLIFIFTTLLVSGFAQSKTPLSIQYESLISSGKTMPFWLVHNQSGKYNANTNANQVVSLEGFYMFEQLINTPIDIELGTNMIANYSGQFDFHFNDLYAKAYLWNWKLEGGLFKEPEYYYNLSSTNGSIDRSNNNRPYPRIRLATNEFIPFIFFKNWFSYKAEYDEGILNDQRVVMDTRLHHKSLFVKAKIAKKVDVTIGLNHYVMWGGISPHYGELPSSFKDYITYITGGAGTSNFPETDQLNIAGNQLGSYLVKVDFPVNNIDISVYASHPFEDKSGMELDNRRDKLYGLFVDLKKRTIISKLMLEHMYTIHQSGHIHQKGVMRGRDNYFNHGYYLNGFTYKGYTLASPLFSPVVPGENKTAIENNRISMYHLGFAGELTPRINWDGKLTYSHNLGTYNNTYPEPKNQFSSLLNFKYNSNQLPFQLSLSLASDYGQLYENRFGAMFSLSKNW